MLLLVPFLVQLTNASVPVAMSGSLMRDGIQMDMEKKIAVGLGAPMEVQRGKLFRIVLTGGPCGGKTTVLTQLSGMHMSL